MRWIVLRKTVLAIGLAVLGALSSSPAQAASGPVIFDAQLTRHGTFENCSSFNVNFVANIRAHYEQFFNDAGQMTLERRHVQFSGTLTNATTGAILPYAGDFIRTFDVSTRTVTLIGERRKTQLPNEGVLAIASGRLVIDTATGATISESGRTDEAYNADICRLLG